jgi:hypothetical protein
MVDYELESPVVEERPRRRVPTLIGVLGLSAGLLVGATAAATVDSEYSNMGSSTDGIHAPYWNMQIKDDRPTKNPDTWHDTSMNNIDYQAGAALPDNTKADVELPIPLDFSANPDDPNDDGAPLKYGEPRTVGFTINVDSVNISNANGIKLQLITDPDPTKPTDQDYLQDFRFSVQSWMNGYDDRTYQDLTFNDLNAGINYNNTTFTEKLTLVMTVSLASTTEWNGKQANLIAVVSGSSGYAK